jgi:photosystem II stability/assembly factor-like uncharacterized protein
VEDGPDKPFLALAFEDEQSGFVVGAYGLIFRTLDGGQTWQPWMDRVDNPSSLHLNAVKIVGKVIYLAGEQGLFLRSIDGGEHFQQLSTPYAGSYFAIAANSSGELLLLGLRGNAYRSDDQGNSFQSVAVPVPVTFTAVANSDDGSLFMANQSGTLLVSHDFGRTIVPTMNPRLPPIAALTHLVGNELISVGYGGVNLVTMKSERKTGDRL